MTNKNKTYELRIIDKYLESVFVYWSALLTLNGLLLTFYSIDALSTGGKSLIFHYLLVCSCALSLWLIVWNFRVIKLTYFEIGQLEDEMPDVPEDVLNKANPADYKGLIDEYTLERRQMNLKRVNYRYRYMRRRERMIEWLLVLETLLVLLMLILRILASHSLCLHF